MKFYRVFSVFAGSRAVFVLYNFILVHFFAFWCVYIRFWYVLTAFLFVKVWFWFTFSKVLELWKRFILKL